jgi:hypothetical protein
MNTNYKILFITLLMIFSLTIFAVEKRWSLDIETGPVFASSNTIQVPNPGGTRFSLSDAFDIDSKIYYRIRLNFLLGKRHQLSALFAPLTLKADGAPDQELRFQDTTFPPGETVNALYRFNSYRLTYRYLLLDKKKLQLWLGFTAKIRDAKILLSSQGYEDDTSNVGFVPLLNLVLDWGFGSKMGLLFEVDALAAPGGQGRAEDVSLSFYHNLGKNTRLRMGYRFIEGGADVEEVYNFAFLNYIYAAIHIRF